MNTQSALWDCWVNDETHIISFHKISGYQWQAFHSHAAFGLYIKAKILEGYRVI